MLAVGEGTQESAHAVLFHVAGDKMDVAGPRLEEFVHRISKFFGSGIVDVCFNLENVAICGGTACGTGCCVAAFVACAVLDDLCPQEVRTPEIALAETHARF